MERNEFAKVMQDVLDSLPEEFRSRISYEYPLGFGLATVVLAVPDNPEFFSGACKSPSEGIAKIGGVFYILLIRLYFSLAELVT